MNSAELELRQMALQMAGNLRTSGDATVLVREAQKILEFLKGGNHLSRPAKKG